MDNFLIYEEIHKRDSCIVYRGRIKRSIDFVMIYCVDKYKRHELSNLVRLMYELDHPNVMKFREWYETTNHLWLVMDLCDGGSLKSIIQADGCLPETSIRTIGIHICQDRPPLSSRLATTDRPESNVSFSLSCTRTSIQIAQQNKPDEIDGNKTHRNDYSSINTHEQSTVFGGETIERLRKMLFTKTELQPTAIIENKTIQKTLPFKFENKLLPFQLGKYENLSRLSSVDLQEHASMIKKELSNTTAGSPTNANGMRLKPHLLNYIGYTCLEQANSGPFADALIAKEIHKDLLNIITNGTTMEL
ncbi:unnamed protein product [Rotaria sp. Silwood1]|nr:unnamed protein product [Rotaria sp. Silwood1]